MRTDAEIRARLDALIAERDGNLKSRVKTASKVLSKKRDDDEWDVRDRHHKQEHFLIQQINNLQKQINKENVREKSQMIRAKLAERELIVVSENQMRKDKRVGQKPFEDEYLAAGEAHSKVHKDARLLDAILYARPILSAKDLAEYESQVKKVGSEDIQKWL